MLRRLRGLSPPVRGSPLAIVAVLWAFRSIPARAGEPRCGDPSPCPPAVYPRPCGGADYPLDPDFLEHGLSPPVRGSPAIPMVTIRRGGSIPARAGEPVSERPCNHHTQVYPRPCGGAVRPLERQGRDPGLSPPVRGSPSPWSRRAAVPRSIPARAGEPCSRCAPTGRSWVYPRPCGGARPARPFDLKRQGLSPPVRGSRADHRAVAGHRVVYPRPCGGAPADWTALPLTEGLSPPVRGSRHRLVRCCRWRRSIPARAGEPLPSSRTRPEPWVYPRPCGGAQVWAAVGELSRGLSPPVRGSRSRQTVLLQVQRSIPARAGEPRWKGAARWPRRVYPRPCGGARLEWKP